MRHIVHLAWYFCPGWWLHQGGWRQRFARRVYDRHYGYLGRVLAAQKGRVVA